MFKPDFTDMLRNGFRVNQFRLFYSPDMRYPKFISRQDELKIAEDLIGERDLLIRFLVEQNEVNYTLHFFSARFLVMLIIMTGLTILFYKGGLTLKLLQLIFTSVLYFLSIRFKENFVMSNFGIQFAESIYNSKIAERYNF